MAAAYDTYDYPNYWVGREYEHEAEVLAIKEFLAKIPQIGTILEIGAGFGRLTPIYAFRAKRVILADPSAKLLKSASQSFENSKKIEFVQSKIENLSSKIRRNSIDVVFIVRVLHHLQDIDSVFKLTRRLLKKGGYLILEFPNKKHIKASFSEFFRGNFTFPIDIFPKDIRTKRSQNKGTLPFFNYHPEILIHKLESTGFEIIEKRSVSNIRSKSAKALLSTNTLLTLERLLQRPLSYINFGPSIFVLAQRTN